jgi:hypothetical protein
MAAERRSQASIRRHFRCGLQNFDNRLTFFEQVALGKSIKGGRVNRFAFVGGELYIAGKDGLTKIPSAAFCLSGCVSQVVAGSANAGHFGK